MSKKLVTFLVLTAQQHFFSLDGVDKVLNPGKPIDLPEDHEYIKSLEDQGFIVRKEEVKTEPVANTAPQTEDTDTGNTGEAPEKKDYSGLKFDELQAEAKSRGLDDQIKGLSSKKDVIAVLEADDQSKINN